MSSSKISRPSYHHGDLANALTIAAMELARTGGPDAVVLREAARKIGVSATAAYRHFASRDDLIHAVKDCALAELAEGMQDELSRVEPTDDVVALMRARLRALGRGYIGFALAKPGLFRTAFARLTPISGPDGIDPMQTAPFLLLVQALDALVAEGLIEPDRRPFLELASWGMVHGMAELILDGPLRHFPADVQQAAVERALDVVSDGILGHP